MWLWRCHINSRCPVTSAPVYAMLGTRDDFDKESACSLPEGYWIYFPIAIKEKPCWRGNLRSFPSSLSTPSILSPPSFCAGRQRSRAPPPPPVRMSDHHSSISWTSPARDSSPGPITAADPWQLCSTIRFSGARLCLVSWHLGRTIRRKHQLPQTSSRHHHTDWRGKLGRPP